MKGFFVIVVAAVATQNQFLETTMYVYNRVQSTIFWLTFLRGKANFLKSVFEIGFRGCPLPSDES